MVKYILYKGQEISSKDIMFVWTDHYGHELIGDIDDMCCSIAEDVEEEVRAGEGW